MTTTSDRIEAAFRRAASEGRPAVVPFVTVGHPQLDSTPDVVEALWEAGADAIELGIPFSDPLAEGPVIQASSYQALQNGVTPQFCFDQAAEIRRRGVDLPLIYMGYYNPMYQLGLAEFCVQARASGVDGVICADLPAAEAAPLLAACRQTGLSLVPLLALTSTDATIRLACDNASGFVYCISLLGVTGARAAVSDRVETLVARVKEHTELPVAVGFGISTAEHVRDVGRYADGAVIGSALIARMESGRLESGEAGDAATIAAEFMRTVNLQPA